MVAIVSGNGLGVLNGSAAVLGQAGLFGKGTHGVTGTGAYVNAANGNLVVSDRDAWLASVGVNLSLTRTYNSLGNLSTGNGPNWKTGPVKSITLSGTLNTSGSSVTRMDADGSVQDYRFDAASGTYRSTDGDGAHDTLSGNAGGWTWTGDARDMGGIHERYDSKGRLVASGEHGVDRLGYGYNAAGQLATVTDASGDVTTYEYQNGKLARIRTTDASGASQVRTHYEYDDLDRLKAVVIDLSPEDGSIADGNVYRTTYAYWDSGSQLRQIRQTDNTELNFTYDAQGRVQTVSDALGQTTRFDYSTPNRTTVTDPTGNRVTYGYDGKGQLTSVTEYGAGGIELVTLHVYDDAGNLSRTISPSGRATVFGYDANGNRVLERDADGRTITRVFDLATNRLVSETSYTGVDPDGDGAATASGALTARFFYDANGQIRFAVSAEARVTEYRYDGQRQLTAQLQYLSAPGASNIASTATLAQWAAQAAGQVAGRVDYVYDARGQVSQATTYASFAANGAGVPDGSHTTLYYAYDAAGNLLTSVDGRGNQSSLAYDVFGRVLAQVMADGTRKVTSYDDAGGLMSVSYYAKGEKSPYRVESFAFDAAGQLRASSAAHDRTTSANVATAYDAAGRVRRVETADGVVTHMLYDSAGRKIADIVGTALTEYVYNADGQLATTIRYAGDVAIRLLETAGGTPLSPDLADLRPTTFNTADRRTWHRYDAGGRLVATVEGTGSGLGNLTRYSYDGLGRLVLTMQLGSQVNISGIVDDRIPDAFGNEATATGTRYGRRFYDGDGKLAATLDGAGALSTYHYDGAGRLVDTATYGRTTGMIAGEAVALARLQELAGPAATHVRNLYDGKGQLVGIVDAANFLTEIAYDAAGNVSSRRQYAIAVANPAATTLADLERSTSPDDRITSYTYNVANQVLTERSATGALLSYGYDSAGRQVSIQRSSDTDAGHTALRRYDGANRLIGELSPEGALRLSMAGSGLSPTQVASIWAEFGIQYTYDAAGNRTSMTDQLGHRTLYLYGEGRLAAAIDPLGNWEKLTYDSFGAVIEITRSTVALNAAQVNALAASGDPDALPLTSAAVVARYYYDNGGQQVYTTDAAGAVRETRYNSFGEIQFIQNYQTPLSKLAASIGNRGHASAATTDLKEALGGASALQGNWYDTAGRVTWTVDANNGVVKRDYDVRGNLSAVTTLANQPGIAANGSPAMLNRLVASLNAALDSTRRYSYDSRGLLLESTDPLGYRTVNGYNAFGQADQVTRYAVPGTAPSSLNSTTRTVFDRDGRVVTTIDGAGAVTVYAYDADGRVVEQITYARTMPPTAQLADIRAAIAAQVLSHAGHDLRQRFVYDANGRLAATLTLQHAVAPANGTIQDGVPGAWRVQAHSYDKAGRLIETNGFARNFPSGDLKPTDTAIADWIQAERAAAFEANSTVRYAYDAANRLVATATAQRGSGAAREWAVEQVTYDGAGNVSMRAIRAGLLKSADPTDAQMQAVMPAPVAGSSVDAITYYRYDAMGRVTATATAMNGSGNTTRWALSTRTYDAAGNLLSVRDFASDVTGALTAGFSTPAPDVADRLVRYAYDAGNRLVATLDAEGGATRIEYDTRGNVVRTTAYATRLAVSGPLTLAALPANAGAADRVTRTFHDLAGNPVLEIGPEGALIARRFDMAGRLVAVTQYASPLSAGERVQEMSTNDALALAARKATAADRTQHYVYDADGALRFSIDALGNMTEKRYEPSGHVVAEFAYATRVTVAPGASPDEVAQAAQQAASAQEGAAATRKTTYVYDAGGRLSTVTDALGQTESYTYDALGHKLTFTNKLGNTWQYAYDAAGRLVRETAPGVHTYADGLPAFMGNWGHGETLQLVTVLEYDALDNLVRRTEAAGVAGKERTTEYRYDAMGRQVETRLPALAVYDSGKESYAEMGMHASFLADSGVRSIQVTYDALGNAVKNRDVGGVVSYKIYDRTGKVTAEIDAAGYATEYVRNAFGDVRSMTRFGTAFAAGSGVSAAAYARAKIVSPSTDRTISYEYDSAGRAVKITEPTVSTYDSRLGGASGYVTLARTTTNEYNAFGEVFRQAVFGQGAGVKTDEAVTRYYYNARGEKTAQIAALNDIAGQRSGYLTTYAYDAAGKLERQTEYAQAFGTWTNTDFNDVKSSAQDRSISYRYDNLGRKTSETRHGVTYTQGAQNGSLVTGDLQTRFDYDAVGNQVAVTDATGGKTFTYYDALGRVTATARKQQTPTSGIEDAGIKLTEFKLDIHGNVVLHIEYADAIGRADERSYDATLQMAQNAANRITASQFDNWGRLLQTLDPEQFSRPLGQRGSMQYSYDIYGRAAKQWRSVTDILGQVRTVFQITGHDAFGRINSVTTPQLADLIGGSARGPNTSTTSYNAFGEVVETRSGSGAGALVTSYDQAGRAWRSDKDGGVTTFRLYDVNGNVTAVLTSTAAATAPGSNPLLAAFDTLSGAYDAARVLAHDDVLRTENRYNLLGQLVDSRVQQDTRLQVLVREAGNWVRKTLGRNEGLGEALLVLGDAGETVNRLRYRQAGGAWTPVPDSSLRVIDGVTVFDPAALPRGAYEYEVTVRTPSGHEYQRGGRLNLALAVDAGRPLEVVSMYLMLFGRPVEREGLDFWLGSANKGVTTAQMFAAMLSDGESRTHLTGSAAQVMRKIFQQAFGTTQNPAGGDPTRIQFWTERYDAATKADGAASFAARGQVLADLLSAHVVEGGPEGLALKARASAIENYVHTWRGSDRALATALMSQASTDPAGAIARGTQEGQLERHRVQLIQMYVALFGRAPDRAGLDFWTASMAKGVTIEQAAESMLGSPESQQPWLYPNAGLTPQQYNEQLVNRAYSLSLGRAPLAAELADWLARLSGPNALTRGQFATQFTLQITQYQGDDALRLDDRQKFANKISTAYAAVVTLGISIPEGTAGNVLLDGISSAGTAQEAAAKALLAAETAANLARNAHNAADIAAGAAPLDDIRRTLSRFYLVLLGRVPDKAGMEFYTPARPYTEAQWGGIALGFLNSNEAATALGNWRAMSNREFVEKLYMNGLGKLPDATAGLAEITAFVARLDGGASREQIAYDIADGMMTSEYLTSAERGLRALLDNRTAVGLTVGLSLTLADVATQRGVLSLVTATDTSAALNYAYAGSQNALTTRLNGLRDGATSAAQLADAMSNAALGNAAALAANATLAANPPAAYRLQLTQLYVAILGRSSTNPPDFAGVQFYVDRNVALEQVVESFLGNTEGAALYGTLNNAQFVDRLVTQMLGSASLISADRRAAWTAQLSATPSATRAKLALAIVNSVLTYSENDASGGRTYLDARASLLQRVSDAFGTLDAATAVEIARINTLRSTLKTSLDQLAAQLPALQAAMNSTESARATAVAAATTALANANKSGDGLATKRLQITRMYATLLQRTSANPPTLADMNFWSSSAPDYIAQQMIDSAEGRPFFTAGSTNAQFITSLYSTILGRAPGADDLTYWGNYLTQNAGKANLRGSLANMILENWGNYTDYLPSQLTYKKLIDDRISGFMTTIASAAKTAEGNAASILTEANRLKTAVDTANANITAAQRKVDAARPAYDDAQEMLSLSSRRKVSEVYGQLRGTADYAGALFWMRNIARGAATAAQLVDSILASEYPAAASSFVSKLYTNVLGRTASAAEVSYYVGLVSSQGRSFVANEIMNSTEARGKVAALGTKVETALRATANSDVSAYTTANTALTTAKTALTTATRNYTNYGWTVATASSAYTAATGVYTSMNALSTAHKSVVDADTKYLAAANAKAAYNAKKAEYDKVNTEYQAALQAPLDKYQAAVALGSTIASAAKAYASAAASLPAVGTHSTAVSVQLQQLTQIYITLLNRAPTLAELHFATERMTSGAKAADIAAGLIAKATALYPAGQSNDAFVRLLYTNGLGRTPDTAGVAFFVDQLARGYSRAEVVINFLSATNAVNNTDTTALNNRTRTILQQLGKTSVTSADVDAIIDAAAQDARQKAIVFNAAGAASLQASADAQRTQQLTRLYVALLNRAPDNAGLNFYADALRRSPALTIEDIADAILTSPEAQSLLPASLGNSQFVQSFFLQAMGRAPTSAELAQFSAMLPARSRGQVAVAIINAVVGYQGTDRMQQTTQLGFGAKVGAALHQLAEKAQDDDAGSQAAIAILKQVLAQPIKDLYLTEPVVVNERTQGGTRSNFSGNNLTVDRWGNVLSVSDARDPGFRITYTYGYDNQLLSQTQNALAGTAAPTSYTHYDALGRAAQTVDFNGNKNSVAYDSLGNIVREYHADGGVVTSKYTMFGNRLWVKQPSTTFHDKPTLEGVTTSYAYDHLGNLTSSKTGGPVEVWVASETDKYGYYSKLAGTRALELRFEYDELGRQIRTIGSDGVATVLEYDANNNVISTSKQDTNANAPDTARKYLTQYVYDAEGNRTASKDANGNKMAWIFENGRMVSSVDMGAATTSYIYDESGRLVRQTSSRGQEFVYGYTIDKLTYILDKASRMETRYTYDAAGNRLTEQQHYIGPLVAYPPQRLQNNTLRYDMQNRLTWIKDDEYELTYAYDNNGNRTEITSKYKDTKARTFYNAFDAMNRQTIVNGDWDISGKRAKYGTYGHEITYDLSGNRLSDTWLGTTVYREEGNFPTQTNVEVKETYTYDQAGRLSTVTYNDILIDTRLYDAGGRITQSGLSSRAEPEVAALLDARQIVSAGRIYSYDMVGNIMRQRDMNTSYIVQRDIYFNNGAEGTGYDAAGNMLGYVIDEPGKQGKYTLTYSLFDTYKEATNTLDKTGVTHTSHYDENGNRVVVSDGKNVISRMWYDAEGHVQSHEANGKTDFNLIVNGQVYGMETGAADLVLGSTYTTVTSSQLSAPPSTYSVQANTETLQSIARNLWGDAALWYLIADANSMTSDTKLEVGQILRIPSRINTVHGDYQTFKPYDPSEIVGSTAPPMPMPADSGGGCGVIGQIVMVVVAVVVTYYTGGGPLSAALGSFASQAVGIAMGQQEGFDWKGVATAALSAGIANGVSSMAGSNVLPSTFQGDTWQAVASRAALSNVVSQGIGVATGLQDSFSWRGVAASAAGAAAGVQAKNYLAGNNVLADAFRNSDFGRAAATSFAAGTATAIARGGKIEVVRIAVDAFGNALANSLNALSSNDNAAAENALTPISKAQAERNLYGGLTLSEVLGGQTDYLTNLENSTETSGGQGLFQAGSFAGDVARRSTEYDWLKPSIPQIRIVGRAMTAEEKLNSIFGLDKKVMFGPAQAQLGISGWSRTWKGATSIVGMVSDGVGAVSGGAITALGGTMMVAPEPVLTKVAGVGMITFGSTFATKSAIGFGLNAINLYHAVAGSPDSAYVPGSALELAVSVAGYGRKEQQLAVLADLAWGFGTAAVMKAPVSKLTQFDFHTMTVVQRPVYTSAELELLLVAPRYSLALEKIDKSLTNTDYFIKAWDNPPSLEDWQDEQKAK